MAGYTNFLDRIRTLDFARANRYACQIYPPSSMGNVPEIEYIPFYIQSANLPEFVLQTMPINDSGLMRQSVIGKSYGQFVMTLYSDKDMIVKSFFDKWAMSAIKNRNGRFAYPTSYISGIDIFVCNRTDNNVYCVTLSNCYPTVVNNVSLSNGSNLLLNFSVAFQYETWESFMIDSGGGNNTRDINLSPDIRNTAVDGLTNADRSIINNGNSVVNTDGLGNSVTGSNRQIVMSNSINDYLTQQNINNDPDVENTQSVYNNIQANMDVYTKFI